MPNVLRRKIPNEPWIFLWTHPFFFFELTHNKNTLKFRIYPMCTGVKHRAHGICTGFSCHIRLYVHMVLQLYAPLYVYGSEIPCTPLASDTGKERGEDSRR